MRSAAGNGVRARLLKPPDRLPAGYREIWRALAEAEGRAGSRQALARQLGVSTQTLQRILVRGDVPVFPQTTNVRVQHSWTRTLSRLARHLGGDPRRWLAQVGISWDDDVQAIVEEARDAEAVDRGSGAKPALPMSIEIGLPDLGLFELAVFPRAFDHIDAGSAGSTAKPAAPAALPASSAAPSRPSAAEVLARIIFGAVDPMVTLRFRRAPETHLADALLRGGSASRRGGTLQREGSIDCALGVLASADRELRGIEFIRIPGWRVRLSAFGVAAASGPAPVEFPSWPAAIFASTAAAPPLMVAENGVAQRHLLGVCGVPADRLRTLPEDHARAARALREAAERAGGGPIVLVDDEVTCRHLAAALEGTAGLVVREIPGTAEWAPSYPLALALSPSARPWRDALLIGLEREAFGASARLAGRLYGELLAAAALPQILRDPFAPFAPRAAVRLHEFSLASAAFLESLVAHLVAAIEERIARQVGAGPEPRWAALLAARHARALLPEAWQPLLRKLPELLPELAGPHCQSCSVTLDEQHTLETTDRYCRFCSEPDGRLKPRAEVHRLIAGWFAKWQRGVPFEEAQRRADFFMQSMPAWAKN